MRWGSSSLVFCSIAAAAATAVLNHVAVDLNILCHANATLKDRENEAEAFLQTAVALGAQRPIEAWRYAVAAYDTYPFNWDLFSSLASNYAAMNPSQVDILLDRVVRHFDIANKQQQQSAELLQQIRFLKKLMAPTKWLEYWARYETLPDPSVLTMEEQAKARLMRAVTLQKGSLLSGPVHVYLPFSTSILRWSTVPILADNHLVDLEDAVMKAIAAVKDSVLLNKDDYEVFGPTQMNNEFFRWQMQVLRDTGDVWVGFGRMDSFVAMKNAMREAARSVLISHGFSEDRASVMSSRNLIIWACVHPPGSTHPAHDHSDAVVSGVFYVQATTKSGAIHFLDPRNPVYAQINELNGQVPHPLPPPFHRGFRISPTRGSLIAFPSWLLHQVEASDLDVYTRISFAFNLLGEWEDTAHLLLETKPHHTSTTPLTPTDHCSDTVSWSSITLMWSFVCILVGAVSAICLSEGLLWWKTQPLKNRSHQKVR